VRDRKKISSSFWLTTHACVVGRRLSIVGCLCVVCQMIDINIDQKLNQEEKGSQKKSRDVFQPTTMLIKLRKRKRKEKEKMKK